MKRRAKEAILLAAIAVCGLTVFMSLASVNETPLADGSETPTFSKEVVRIFQNNCQVCHPGDIAPFSLMTYEEAAPWAFGIKEVTRTRYMPP